MLQLVKLGAHLSKRFAASGVRLAVCFSFLVVRLPGAGATS